MNKYQILIFFVLTTNSCHANVEVEVTSTIGCSQDDERHSVFKSLAAKYGFPNVEAKDIITEDGYILTLHHIPGDPKRPVLLAHGNTGDSTNWLLRGNTSLSIILAKRGYDVWAINFRGNRYSRRHVYLDPDTERAQFFNFTFYEQAVYDLPATIDFILEETNQTQLLAVGHSVGTTNFYVLGSEKPEYNDKVKIFISLAPITFLQDVRGAVALGIPFGNTMIDDDALLDEYEVLGSRQLGAAAFNSTCLGPDAYEKCVEGIVFPLFGPDPKGFEPEFIRPFFSHFPSGSSTKLFKHLIQVIHRNKFVNYDFGAEGNMVRYGTEEPPEFDLSKVSMKIALFVGQQDYLASVPDAERLRCALPNVVHYQVLPYCQFNHLDFVWGKNMPTDLYPYLLPIIDKYID